MVNDVHRTIKIDDEYLEYYRQLHEDNGIAEFMLNQALATVESETVKEKIEQELEKYKVEEEEQANCEQDDLETESEIVSSEQVEIVEEHFELDGIETM